MRPRKTTKTQNLQNLVNRLCQIHEIEEIYQFLGQSEHFGRRDSIFRRKSGFENFDAKFAKMAVFGPKNGRFSRVFKNILEFDKNH